jgi:D-alanyl-D-alanine carboxypeptidase/D-alanyl-D-alanine-endopeptidase (penicillin-binding protein 4)
MPPPEATAFDVALVSHPLAGIVRVVNSRSQNLHAEMLLRLADVRGRPRSVAGGLRAEREVLARYGVDTTRVDLVDGSGLSRDNILSAGALATLLRSVYVSAPWKESYWTSLLLAGRDGALRRLAGTSAAGRVRAKTGTLAGVRSLAGLAEPPDGAPIVFAAILHGRPDSERAEERLLDSLVVGLTAALPPARGDLRNGPTQPVRGTTGSQK